MKYLHTMVRVTDLDVSLDFYCNKLGLQLTRRSESPAGRYTLAFVSAPGDEAAAIELTYNWPPEVDQSDGQPAGQPERLGSARNFGHVAYAVENIYATCQKLMDAGVTINRPPRDGRMAFVRSPDNISIELLQAGPALPPQEPWTSMANTGVW
jgi:lactoylglutathione lyase